MNNQLVSFLPILVLVVFAYFMLIRPQRKQQKKMDNMMSGLKAGDEVMTAGGFYGIVYAVDEENVVLEILPDFTKAMIRKASIVKVITQDEAEDETEAIEEKTETTAEEAEVVEDVKDDADHAESKED